MATTQSHLLKEYLKISFIALVSRTKQQFKDLAANTIWGENKSNKASFNPVVRLDLEVKTYKDSAKLSHEQKRKSLDYA